MFEQLRQQSRPDSGHSDVSSFDGESQNGSVETQLDDVITVWTGKSLLQNGSRRQLCVIDADAAGVRRRRHPAETRMLLVLMLLWMMRLLRLMLLLRLILCVVGSRGYLLNEKFQTTDATQSVANHLANFPAPEWDQ